MHKHIVRSPCCPCRSSLLVRTRARRCHLRRGSFSVLFPSKINDAAGQSGFSPGPPQSWQASRGAHGRPLFGPGMWWIDVVAGRCLWGSSAPSRSRWFHGLMWFSVRVSRRVKDMEHSLDIPICNINHVNVSFLQRFLVKQENQRSLKICETF